MMKLYGITLMMLCLNYSCLTSKTKQYPFFSKFQYEESKGGVSIPNTEYKGIEFTVKVDGKKVKCYYHFHSYYENDPYCYRVLQFDSLGKLQDIDVLVFHKLGGPKSISLDTLNNSRIYRDKNNEVIQTLSGKKYFIYEELSFGKYPSHLTGRKSYLDFSIPDSISNKPFTINEEIPISGHCKYRVVQYGNLSNDGILDFTFYYIESDTLNKVGDFRSKIISGPKKYKQIFYIDEIEGIFIDGKFYKIGDF